MIKTLLTTLKQDKETFEVPKSVQDAIPDGNGKEVRRCHNVDKKNQYQTEDRQK